MARSAVRPARAGARAAADAGSEPERSSAGSTPDPEPILSGARPLVLVAHGSADPRFAATVDSIAALVRRARPGLDVRVGYLDHGPPTVEDALRGGEPVAVPLLLTGGYHLRVDLPSRVDDVLVTSPVGRDPRLAAILAERLVAAKAPAGAAVTLAAAGSVDPAALADVRAAAAALAARLQVGVEVGYLSAGDPELTRDWRQDRVGPGQPWVLAPYLLAPGRFYDRAVALGADVVAEPIGAHPLLAAVVLERYDGVAGVDRGVTQDAGQVPGRTAPA